MDPNIGSVRPAHAEDRLIPLTVLQMGLSRLDHRGQIVRMHEAMESFQIGRKGFRVELQHVVYARRPAHIARGEIDVPEPGAGPLDGQFVAFLALQQIPFNPTFLGHVHRHGNDETALGFGVGEGHALDAQEPALVLFLNR